MEEDPFTSLLHLTDVGYYPTAQNHYRRRKEPISQWLLIYYRKGKGWYAVDGRRWKVGPDSYFILPPGHPHEYDADSEDPWTIYWVHYKGSAPSFFKPESQGPISVKPGHTSRITDRLELFEEIMTTLGKGYSRNSLAYTGATLFSFYLL